jgi:lysophospholipase L1-like esterase
MILIGDSITHGWEATGASQYNALKTAYGGKVTNLGFSGDLTQHVIWRLQNGEFPEGINPEWVVLHIGTNNNSPSRVSDEDYNPNSCAAGIGRILEIIHARAPQAKILLMLILPRDEGTAAAGTIRNNAVNDIIKNYAGLLNIRIFDIRSSFLNEDGTLKTELFRDNLHLTAAGFGIWAQKLVEATGDQLP